MDKNMMDANGIDWGLKDVSPVPCCMCQKSYAYPGYFYNKDLNVCICMGCFVGIQLEHDWTDDQVLGYIEHIYSHKAQKEQEETIDE